jgi:hypothetical protein
LYDLDMPWNPSDAHRHKRGLSEHQAKQWAEVANSVLERTGDEGKAVKQANGVVGRPQGDRH